MREALIIDVNGAVLSVLSLFKFSINEMCFVLLALYVVLIIILVISLYIDNLKKYLPLIIPLIVLLMLINIFALIPQISILDKMAVVVVENIDSRFEPFDSATAHFRLFEGTKVLIIQKRGDWYKIERADKKIGWIESSALEII